VNSFRLAGLNRLATALTLALALLAVAAPILLSLELAERQGISREKAHALSLAEEVQRRSDAVADQFGEAVEKLRAIPENEPCGPEHVEMMRRIDLASSYIQAIGHVTGTRLDCSSLGTLAGGIDLGPFELTTRATVRLRRDVELPFVHGKRFLVLERDGYAAIIHKAIPLGVVPSDAQASLGVFSLGDATPLTSRGPLAASWATTLFEHGATTYVADDHVIAAVRSPRYDTGTVAALPASRVSEQMHAAALLLVPIGCMAGLALAFAVLTLIRLQLAMPSEIKSALKRNEFFMAYQPVVDLRTGEWVGAEALIRWQRPSGELVRPDIFISVAEEAGLIKRITQRVIELIGKEAGALIRARPDFHLAINLSSVDLESRDSITLLGDLCGKRGFRPRNLIVEATERGFLKADLAREVVKELRERAFRIAIDDFGTGYSSLAYLETFELDYLKIDKSFVDTVGKQAATSHVVQHIIEMAKSLGLEMIAEGVETEAQASFLRERGVQYAQGWLFAKPMPLKDILSRISVGPPPKSTPTRTDAVGATA
jgi:sensor c-di-GMP phosphodiesterase-like protein